MFHSALETICDELLSSFAFNFSLRRCTLGRHRGHQRSHVPARGRVLHSSTSLLNLSRFCH